MKAQHSLRWGLITSAAALALILLFALFPDPFSLNRTLTTRFDNVEGVAPGVPVMFAGMRVGKVKSVALDPDTRLFDVKLAVSHDWRPAACSFARIAGANPLSAPSIELAAPAGAPAQCAAVRVAAKCDALVPAPGRATIDGCRRAGGLFAAAAVAVDQAAAAAKTVNATATRLATMLGVGKPATPGQPGKPPLNMAKLAADSTATLAAVAAITQSLSASMRPGRGDVALTLANVRRATGRAGDFDMATVNATLHDVQSMIRNNQATIAALLQEGRDTTAATRGMLEGMQGSLSTTSANLARASDSVEALTERMAADPTFVVRGNRYADPPAPGGKK